MLAGYLPFDDDPANPEGDNINLLYKYICNTPLVFPGYVSPHAKDVLRRILVADPNKRADLFEVARHSWLSEYSNNVEAITSGVPLPNEKRMIPKIPRLNQITNPDSLSAALSRSASTKEPAKAQKQVPPVGLSSKPARSHITQEAQQPTSYKSPRNTDRRTIQVEYVAPPTQTNRTNGTVPPLPSGTSNQARDTRADYEDRPMPPEKDLPAIRTPDKVSANGRPSRNAARSASDTAYMTSQAPGSARPSTGGSTGGMPRLPPSRGSYGQPSAAAVAPTNVEGRFTQPSRTSQKPYNISSPLPQVEGASRDSRAASSHTQPSSQPRQSVESSGNQARGHRRSHTLTNIQDKILGRSSTLRRAEPRSDQRPKPDRAYPPTSMRPVEVEAAPRKSTESRESRRSFGLNRHKNDAATKEKRTSRRFSILPRSTRTPTSSQPGSQPSPQPGYRQPGPAQNDMAQSNNPWSDGEPGTVGEAAGPDSEEAFDEYEKRGPLPGKNRRFNEAYEKREGAGSSGAARRVMELFRRRK